MSDVDTIKCPVCASQIDGEVHACERCDTPHHVDCWEYAGGCAIFGCVPSEIVRTKGQELDLSALQRSTGKLISFYRVSSVIYVLASSFFLSFPIVSLLALKYISVTNDVAVLDKAVLLFFTILEKSWSVVVALVIVGVIAKSYYHYTVRADLNCAVEPQIKAPVAVLNQVSPSPFQQKTQSILKLIIKCSHFLSIPAFIVLGGLLVWNLVGTVEYFGYTAIYALFLLYFTMLVLNPIQTAHDNLLYLNSLENRFAESFKEKNTDFL